MMIWLFDLNETFQDKYNGGSGFQLFLFLGFIAAMFGYSEQHLDLMIGGAVMIVINLLYLLLKSVQFKDYVCVVIWNALAAAGAIVLAIMILFLLLGSSDRDGRRNYY